MESASAAFDAERSAVARLDHPTPIGDAGACWSYDRDAVRAWAAEQYAA